MDGFPSFLFLFPDSLIYHPRFFAEQIFRISETIFKEVETHKPLDLLWFFE